MQGRMRQKADEEKRIKRQLIQNEKIALVWVRSDFDGVVSFENRVRLKTLSLDSAPLQSI